MSDESTPEGTEPSGKPSPKPTGLEGLFERLVKTPFPMAPDLPPEEPNEESE